MGYYIKDSRYIMRLKSDFETHPLKAHLQMSTSAHQARVSPVDLGQGNRPGLTAEASFQRTLSCPPISCARSECRCCRIHILPWKRTAAVQPLPDLSPSPCWFCPFLHRPFIQCRVGPITAACAGFTRLRSLWVFGPRVPSPPSPLQMTMVPQDPAQSPSTLRTLPCATSAVLGARGPHPLAQSCSVPRRADLVEMSMGRCQPHECDWSWNKRQASNSHPKAP